MKKIDASKTLFLIDGSSFLYRAYYSLRPLHTAAGEPVQAVYGFCRMLKKLIDTFNPVFMVLVWDSKGLTRRHEVYAEYKATRQAPPSDIFEQKKYIQEFADTIGLTQIAQPGLEADDIMYSLALDAQAHGSDAILVSSDKDLAQALTDHIVLFDPLKERIIDSTVFHEEYGFPPSKLPFYFALVGDASDNIPGVRGIGKKGAAELVQQFDSLKDLYANIDAIGKERTRAALLADQDNAFLSHGLFLLQYEHLNLSLQACAFSATQWERARGFFEKLGFKSLLKGLPSAGAEQQLAIGTPSLAQEKGYVFATVRTQAQLDEVVALLKQYRYCALDTETDGLAPLASNLVGISVCVQEGTAYYIPCGHLESDGVLAPEQLPRETVLAALKPLLEDSSVHKALHHAKHDALVLWNAGIRLEGIVFDTLVAASLVTQDWQSIGLKSLSQHYFNEQMLTYQQMVKDKKLKNFAYVAISDATEYAAADAHQTCKLVPLLKQKLQECAMENLYETIELPLITVLYDMEREGISCDARVLAQLDSQVSRDLETLRHKIIAVIGTKYETINLNSPKQLEELLFTHLGLPPVKRSDKRTSFSTDQEVLQELAKLHPVPGLILRYRELYKLKSTYIDALPTYINKHTGRIHTTFSQTSAATGRLASFDPNLQNIPTNSHSYDIHIRSAFKAEAGRVFLAADYSQIELRVLAYLSQEPRLIASFLAGEDIHARTAAGIFEVPLAEVTHAQRQVGKRINFSILYGLTPFGLAKDLEIPFKEAKGYIERYFEQYPKVLSWMDSVIAEAKQQGYVTTLWGRRRAVPGIYEKNKMLYDLARRIAINMKGQGTAADIMKLGMINLHTAIKRESYDAKMLLQIHDELLISVAQEQAARVEQMVKETLEGVVHWNIPLEVSVRTGATWQDVTK